jgi:putative ABC transport system substrate-binding protein
MRRREFIALIGSATVCPLAVRAQQGERMRRIGVLNSLAETDAEPQAWDAAFRKRLNELGWIEGRNIQLDYRWAAGKVERLQEFAEELVRLNPEVLVAITTPATAALHARTRTIPIVFTVVADPMGSGFVANLAKPDGNITGFANYEPSLSGKWLGLMREVAPSVSRVGFLFNPQTAPFARPYLDTFHSAALALAIKPIEVPFHSAAEIEAMMIKLGREGGAGVIVLPDTSTVIYRETILSLAETLPIAYHLPVPPLCHGRRLNLLWN